MHRKIEKLTDDGNRRSRGQRPDPAAVEKHLAEIFRRLAGYPDSTAEDGRVKGYVDRLLDERVTPIVLGLEARSPFRPMVTTSVLRIVQNLQGELSELKRVAQRMANLGEGQAEALEEAVVGDPVLWMPQQRLDLDAVGSRMSTPLMPVDTVVELVRALMLVKEPFTALRREIEYLAGLARFPVPVRITHQDACVCLTDFETSLDTLSRRLDSAVGYASDVELGFA